MNTKMRGFSCWCVLGVAIDLAQAGVPDNDVTFTLVPVGGISATGAQTIALQGFLTPNATLRFESGAWDLPCVVTPQPGGIGTMTVTGSCSDCDGDGDNTSDGSSGSIPFLFGACGIHAHSPSNCLTAMGPCLGGPFSVVVPVGVPRYMGTVNYLVSDCATGQFNINFECTDQPDGLCDNDPEPSNTTRIREDNPPGPAAGPLMSIVTVATTITVPQGPCCVGSVFGSPGNGYCCETVQGGCTDYRLVGDGCAPAIYGDTYPSESGGDGMIDVDDLLCFHASFTFGAEYCPSSDIWPCGGGDGLLDVDDLIAVLGAFVGTPQCPDPCE